MKRYTAPLVIAETFYLDYAEMKDSKYKPWQTDKPVYIVGDDYYCAGKIGTKPAKSTRNGQIEFEWKEYKSWFADQIGWQVWEHKCK